MATARRIARDIAARVQAEIVGTSTGASRAVAHAIDLSEYDIVPRGRTVPFSTLDYDVVPKGRFDIVPRNYYSPIPDLKLLPADVWTRRSALAGIELNTERCLDFLERRMAPYVGELELVDHDPGEPGRFYLQNKNFETVDAELLYAMVRAMRPARLIELGSGFSTLLINLACRRNVTEGAQTTHLVFDPHPRPAILGDRLPEPTTVESLAATDVPPELFASLGEADILFVDTTHTVKLGSDVNFVVLDVLPRLAPGVIVHFHDVFLPWEYPRHWFEDMAYFWAEQYLLQAFLAHNRDWEVLLPNHLLARDHADRLTAVVPSFNKGGSPGSIWLRRLTDEEMGATADEV